jgi:hypothetical protein
LQEHCHVEATRADLAGLPYETPRSPDIGSNDFVGQPFAFIEACQARSRHYSQVGMAKEKAQTSDCRFRHYGIANPVWRADQNVPE